MSESNDGLQRRSPEPLVQRQPSGGGLGELRSSDFVGDVRLLSVMRALQRRRWVILGVLSVFIVGAVVFNLAAKPVYEARARLLIEPESAQMTPFRPVFPEDQGRVDYFVTQMEVLRSRALARQTLEQLKQLSAEDPVRQSAQIDGFMASLAVSPVRTVSGESRVVNVTFRASDPKTAALYANTLVQRYVDQNLDVRREGSQQASKWLNDRLAELREQVNTSQQAMQRYRENASDAVALQDPQNIANQKLAQLNTALTAARTELEEKRAVYEQLQAIQAAGLPLDTFPPIQSNQFVQQLKSELAGLRRERLELADKLGPAHPDMVKLDVAVENAEQRLTTEMAKVVASVRNDYESTQARARGLDSALAQQKRQLVALSQQSIGYTAIQRDAASTQQVFESIQQRVKETDLAGELQTNNARVLDLAEMPRRPVWPRPLLNLLLALVGGSVAAVAVAVGVEYLNPRLSRPDDISTLLGIPLLGVAPVVPGMREGIRADSLPPIFFEALRAIRTRVLLSPVTSVARTLAVTSTNPGEGKTTVASCLAMSMAAAGRRVLLVDADLRRPQQHLLFGEAKTPGLRNVLAGAIKVSDAVVQTTTPGLFLLPAGDAQAGSMDLLESERLRQIVSSFGEQFDLVILDSPPVLAVADAAIVGNAASAVLFVVAAGQTSRDIAQVALDRLATVQAYVAGVVLNKFRPDPRTEYYYAPNEDYSGDPKITVGISTVT